MLIACCAAYLATPAVVTGVAWVLAGLIGVWGSWGLWRRVQTHEHHTRYLRPLHDALRTSVGQTATRPEQWLHIPRDFQENPGVEMRIDLPSAYDASDGTANHIKTVVRNKLGLASDTTFHFHTAGNRPYVTCQEPVRPPTKVTYADIMARISQAKETAPIIGLAAGLRAITVDLENDSPHVLVSAGSGAGKSVLLRTILSQALAKGGYGIILDIKRVSHMWAANLPNCEYHRSAEAIHERLLGLQVEVNRRNDLAERYADIDGNTDHVDVGPRIWLLAEEMNATINRLNKYWREIKEKGDPNTSPAVEALLDLLFMGRQIKIHVVSVAQMASARTMGGPEARENYATRCLSRYTMNAWRMLCPEVWPMPKKPKQIGRWQIVTAGVATETQIAFFTPREARELALRGRPGTVRDELRAPVESLSDVSHDHDDLGQGVRTVPGTAADPAEPGPVPADAPDDAEIVEASRLIGLRQAVSEDLVNGMTLESLRKTAQRDVHFPESRGKNGAEKLYDAAELGVWARNRRLAKDPDEEPNSADRRATKATDSDPQDVDDNSVDDEWSDDTDDDDDNDD
ncbi:MAG: ATP-binding protein [Pseudonocardia sp.]|nr:ATP-binding protein [Pseudonocardia sp.]